MEEKVKELKYESEKQERRFEARLRKIDNFAKRRCRESITMGTT